MGTGDKTQTVVIDEVQCKYCLRTVNQKMDLIKHYRFCLGLKGSQKTAAEVRVGALLHRSQHLP